jgi:dTMP kinase
MQQRTQGVFITIEGIEGVGKSTAVKFIEKYFLDQSTPIMVTREPGGTSIAEQIRKVLLTPHVDEIMLAETELLLMFASRAQHIATVIVPALADGKCVISDRFNDASFAYQGGGRGIDLAHIQMLDEWIVKRHPDLTILLDASPEMGLMRAKNRGPQDRIEQEKTAFFDKVRAIYLERAKQDTKRFRIIDASQSIEVVQQQIKAILDQFQASDVTL